MRTVRIYDLGHNNQHVAIRTPAAPSSPPGVLTGPDVTWIIMIPIMRMEWSSQ